VIAEEITLTFGYTDAAMIPVGEVNEEKPAFAVEPLSPAAAAASVAVPSRAAVSA